MKEGTYFIIKKTHQFSTPTCVFSLSKKKFKTAVLRNKIKRQLRSILSHIPQKQSLLLIPKKEIVNATYKDIQKDLLRLLNE